MKTIIRLNGKIERISRFDDFLKQKDLFERNKARGYFDNKPELKEKIFAQLLNEITEINTQQ